MQLYGKEFSVSALRKRIGNMDQVAGIQLVTLDDGNERGVRAAILRTGAGLEVTVRLDNGQFLAVVQADEGEAFRAGERVRVLRDGGTTRVSR